MYIYLEHILCSIIVSRNHQSLHQSRDAVLRKFLVHKGKGQGLEVLEGQVRGVDGDLVFDQSNLEGEGDLLAALLRHCVA